MTFPLIADYKTAVANPKGRFATLEILPLRDARRKPIVLAGNFAGVFKVKDGTGTTLALKCFTRAISDLAKRYPAVAEFIRTAQSPYLVPLTYLPDELFVTSSIAPHKDYPVVTMPWIEGRSLGTLVETLCTADRRSALAGLTIAWARLCLDLLRRRIAHGDLKHDNIFVTPEGTLKLVDYDSIFLPKFKGFPSPILGGINFQHPLRDVRHFDETIDHFSMLVILLSLRALTFEPELFARYHNGENLIFGRQDFLAPERSILMRQLQSSPDVYVRDWAERVVISSRSQTINIPGLAAILKTATTLGATPAKTRQRGLFGFFS